ncbi:helix-turn-helix transcriptional regulator [Pseudonocardia oroxyli]|uniref:Predicted ATPase n=1 Tax=Pseudonocardia oroxyli TaxID=366584 RepID=A0A1G7R2D2_PSEOR|nr:LuxR C-terminal-related transcriptional regulator [Pseudonocardia oroxyli]SDG04864.1 Predicted ATPase [Pseudonocardia oroxyli]
MSGELTSFVGRVGELSELRQLLRSKRLITLLGPGGVGKTRLALRAAARNHGAFPGGARVVELAPARQTDLLATVLVDALGLGRSSRPPLDLVVEELRLKPTLLVLDNCEHLAAEVGTLVERLLCAAPTLHVLATSRQPLAVQSEQLFTVAPLHLPDDEVSLEGALAYSAMTLFADRASAAVPGFSITEDNVADVAALCRRLEGIPLAIELAAVRLKVLSLRELGERLQDRFRLLADVRPGRPARHQTLRTTLDWTCELCTPLEQRLWACASLFAGGFTLDALEYVCVEAGTAQPDEVLVGLSGLVDKSVLVRAESNGRVRFRMLETIREYGLNLLDAVSETRAKRDRARDCYLQWCRRLVDEQNRDWFYQERETFAELGTEHNNLRAALWASTADAEHHAVGLHIAVSLWFYWLPRAPSEGRQWLERLLAASAEDPPSVERMRALILLAYLLVIQGERVEGRELLRVGLIAAEQLGDLLGAGYARHILGLAEAFDGDPDGAGDLLDQAEAIYREHGASEGWRVCLAMHTGLLRTTQGRTVLAAQLFTDAAETCERHGEQWLYSYVLYGLSLIDHWAGRGTAALDRLARSARMKGPFDDVIGSALIFELAAWIRADQGDGQRAAVALGAAGRLWREFGMELYDSRTWLEYRRRCVEQVTALIGHAALAEWQARGTSVGRPEALALVLDGDTADRTPAVRSTPTAPTTAVASPDQPRGLGGSEPTLTRREAQIAAFVAQGMSNRTIAQRLTLSTRTIEGHVQTLLTKLGFSSRAQIAAWVSTRSGSRASVPEW